MPTVDAFPLRAHRRPGIASGGALHRLLIVLAVLAVMTNGLWIKLGSSTLTSERVLGIGMLPLLAYVLLANGASRRGRTLAWLWLGWCGVLAMSAVFATSFAKHIAPLVTAMLPIAYLALMVFRRVDGNFLQRLLRWAVWISAVAGVLVVALTRSTAGRHALSVFLGVDGRLRLLVFEPNMLGSALGALILATLPRARLRWADFLLYACALFTLAAAGSKMPIIGLVVGFFVYLLLRAFAQGRSINAVLIVPTWLAVSLGALLLSLLPSVERLYSSTLARPDAIASRTYVNSLAIERFKDSPVLGRGPGDLGLIDVKLIRDIGTNDRRNLWVSQMMLSILHDSGILGTFVYVIFLVSLFSLGFGWVRQGSLDHCGYFAAMFSLFVCSQATTVHLNAIFGLFAGLLASAPLRLHTGERRRRWLANAPRRISSARQRRAIATA